MAQRQFRDGKREIPDYMHDLMQGLQTHKMTYDQAVAAMNEHQVSSFIDRSFSRVVTEHFVRNARR